MSGIRNLFRSLIKLEEDREHLAETSPNAFEELSLVSYPESWETQGKEEAPKSLSDMEPFCLNWTDFDMEFQGKWDLIVEENDKPLPEEEDDTEGFRDVNDPPINLDDYPHLPSIYCKRAQPLKLPRTLKKLPFPVYSPEDIPALHVKPWMLEAFPPSINWEKQHYKGWRGDYIQPMLVRWNEYPDYDLDEIKSDFARNPPPTVKDMAIDYAESQSTSKKKKKQSGMMTHLEIEEEPMNPDDVEYYFEQKRKDETFRNMLVGHRPDRWFETTRVQDKVDFSNHEIVGGKERTLSVNYKTIKEFVAGNVLQEPKLPREKREPWRGKKSWGRRPYDNDNRPKEGEGGFFRPRGPYRGPSEYNKGSWTGKVASGWNQSKLPKAPEPQEEFFDPPHPEERKEL